VPPKVVTVGSPQSPSIRLKSRIPSTRTRFNVLILPPKQRLGDVVAMTPAQVHEVCVKAAAAQKTWSKTTFAQRRAVLRTIQRYIVHHIDDICRVSSRDSGKPVGTRCWEKCDRRNTHNQPAQQQARSTTQRSNCLYHCNGNSFGGFTLTSSN
jgi:acyl-CoA reductase-like NAD-dependent aldehyde dehydrogenase